MIEKCKIFQNKESEESPGGGNLTNKFAQVVPRGCPGEGGRGVGNTWN